MENIINLFKNHYEDFTSEKKGRLLVLKIGLKEFIICDESDHYVVDSNAVKSFKAKNENELLAKFSKYIKKDLNIVEKKPINESTYISPIDFDFVRKFGMSSYLVLECLKENNIISNKEIALKIGMSLRQVSTIVRNLTREGLLTNAKTYQTEKGKLLVH